MMKTKETDYSAPSKQVLTIGDHYINIGYKHAKGTVGTPGLSVLDGGRYVVKAGTLYPSNDSSAIGVVFQDYDVNDGDAMMAVIVHGFVQTSKMPTIPVADAISALKQITFFPVTDMSVALATTPLAIDEGDAADSEYSVSTVVSGATFRDEATDTTKWTVTGESTTKIDVDTVTLLDNNKTALIGLKASATTVAGSITVLPTAGIMSTGKTITSAVTIATVA